MKIPYGISDFGSIRDRGFFYADKTPFLPVLEAGYEHLVFLRPRRFGKSTLVSMLEHYYDVGRRPRFDALFGGLWVHAHPTAEQGSYLVLTLDFSGVATDRGEDALRRTFLAAVRGAILTLLLRYRERFPPLADLYTHLHDFEDAEALIGQFLHIVTALPHKLYVLIDEYDHFGNRLLSAGQQTLYEAIVQKTGFVRSFYAALKSGTRSGAVGRMFVTGSRPSCSMTCRAASTSRRTALSTRASRRSPASREPTLSARWTRSWRRDPSSQPFRRSAIGPSCSPCWRSITMDTASRRGRASGSSTRTWCSTS